MSYSTTYHALVGIKVPYLKGDPEDEEISFADIHREFLNEHKLVVVDYGVDYTHTYIGYELASGDEFGFFAELDGEKLKTIFANVEVAFLNDDGVFHDLVYKGDYNDVKLHIFSNTR